MCVCVPFSACLAVWRWLRVAHWRPDPLQSCRPVEKKTNGIKPDALWSIPSMYFHQFIDMAIILLMPLSPGSHSKVSVALVPAIYQSVPNLTSTNMLSVIQSFLNIANNMLPNSLEEMAKHILRFCNTLQLDSNYFGNSSLNRVHIICTLYEQAPFFFLSYPIQPYNEHILKNQTIETAEQKGPINYTWPQ